VEQHFFTRTPNVSTSHQIYVKLSIILGRLETGQLPSFASSCGSLLFLHAPVSYATANTSKQTHAHTTTHRHLLATDNERDDKVGKKIAS